MKRKIILPVVIVVALVAAAAVAWWRQNHSTPATERVLHGNADIRQLELAFNASERIADMRVREGDRVGKGQLLATLDHRGAIGAAALATAGWLFRHRMV